MDNATLRSRDPISDPAEWHRCLCEVTPQLFLCGDLHPMPHRAAEQLAEWQRAGITHIVDVRIEANDSRFVEEHAPDITYVWLGVDDDGGHQPDEWFDLGAGAILQALADPDAKVVVHCHMGVNRGPSMGFAAMLAMGWDPTEAATAIRAARPIAALIYAHDALDWWQRQVGTLSTDEAEEQKAELRHWFEHNWVNEDWIIRRIARGSIEF